ncbi:MAG: F0F1 ATP synthase subunit B [Candidatus Eisenbacteria bacterium]|uniref:ATP synthase subunit b n=1 Tax=Eiseniibacteriota bacterium TaxID=2212470 RepID=A0A538TEY0_UNCEI|nr:MAG: F0F1 ATP synthase subunit B [Candidatus Eisenbacteria bacterium]
MEKLVHLNQLLAHAISFIIFLFLVRGAFNAIIFPPMRERRERIRAEFERIEREKAEVQKIRQEYEAHSKKLDAESRQRIQEAVAEGQRVAGEIREASRKEAQEMITRARQEIGIERDKAQATLRNEVVDLAVEIAGKVIREELTAEKHRKLVDEFLAEVEEVK